MGAALGGSLVNFGLSKLGQKKSKRNAAGIVPLNVNTGNSNFNTRTGQLDLDPSIRQGQDDFLQDIRGLVDPANAAFDASGQGIRDLQGRSADQRASFEGNQSAFRETLLDPTRKAIAEGRGRLDRELGRTDVRGSFANQSRTNFELDAGRSLRTAEAQIENQRINKLGDFLQIDANLLKAGLTNETRRTQLLSQLAQSLRGVSTERFSQELQALGLPANFIQGNAAAANINANADGRVAEAGTQLLGDVVGSFDKPFNSSDSGIGTGGTFDFVNNENGFVGGF